MILVRLRTILFFVLFACLNGAWAQAYHVRPVRFIVPFPPGARTTRSPACCRLR